MNNTSFSPVFEVGLANDSLPACRQIRSVSIDPPILAGMCIAILDSIISKLPDNTQIQFEEETAKLFNYMLDARHGHVSSVVLNTHE